MQPTSPPPATQLDSTRRVFPVQSARALQELLGPLALSFRRPPRECRCSTPGARARLYHGKDDSGQLSPAFVVVLILISFLPSRPFFPPPLGRIALRSLRVRIPRLLALALRNCVLPDGREDGRRARVPVPPALWVLLHLERIRRRRGCAIRVGMVLLLMVGVMMHPMSALSRRR